MVAFVAYHDNQDYHFSDSMRIPINPDRYSGNDADSVNGKHFFS
jgi:hypothetical protein